MSRHVRLYRGLLRIYPASFRAEYADEMTRLFGEQVVDATASGRPLAILRLWAASLVDLMVTAPGHHIGREEPVPRPVDIGAGNVVVSRSGLTVGSRIALGLLPLWLIGFLGITAPGFMEPIFANPPAILGIPAGIVMVLIALAWMALGVLVLQRTATAVGALIAFLVFTAPSAFAALLMPAVILIIQNLAV